MSRFFLAYMNVASLIGKKVDQTQGFLEDGTRVPLSIISLGNNIVTQIKTEAHEGYNSIQLGFDVTKRANKPTLGHIKKAGLTKNPRFFREIRVDEAPGSKLGTVINVSEVFEPGDIIDVSGISKGKGFAGVVKRHGFHGGPRTHGQSDRERAPGSIGQTTTPGRVYRGKKMAGRMGNEKVTIKNLEVLDVKGGTIYIKGLIPGVRGSMVILTKIGRNKIFLPLYSENSVSLEASETSENKNENTKQVKAEKEVHTEIASGETTSVDSSDENNSGEASTKVKADSAESSVETREDKENANK